MAEKYGNNAVERLEAFRQVWEDRERLVGILEGAREEGVAEELQRRLSFGEGLVPEHHVWNDVVGDPDADAHIDAVYGAGRTFRHELGSLRGVGSGVDAQLGILKSTLEDGEGARYLFPDVARDVARKFLAVTINRNPRERSAAEVGRRLFGPVVEALGGQYENPPNGLPWVYAGGANPRSLITCQGWTAYTPLGDLTQDSAMQVFGVLGTATDVEKIIYDDGKRIQFSSWLANIAALRQINEQGPQQVVWAVRNFVERYVEDAEFRLLADGVLRLTAKDSWVSYPDKFGNLIVRERFGDRRLSEVVEGVKDGEDLKLVLGDEVVGLRKVPNLADAGISGLSVYLNGEDGDQVNISVPWVGLEDKAKVRQVLLCQGLNELNVEAELVRSEAVLRRRDDGDVLELDAHRLLLGPEAEVRGPTLAGKEIRILRGGADDNGVRDAQREVGFSQTS